MGGADLEIGGTLHKVDLEGVGIAGGEGVPLHLQEEVGGRALDGVELLSLHAQLGQGGEQGPGIGVPGVVKDLLAGADLHNVPGVHDGNAVGHIGHHAQVVGNIDGSEVVFLLKILDELEDLGLDGHIQGGGGLVADEDLGPAGHGDGDDHPLAHTAGELVGILLGAALRLVDAHLLQHLEDLGVGLGPLETLVEDDGLLDLVADGLERVEGGHGVLHDHGDLPAADGAPLLVGGVPGQVLAVVADLPGRDRAVGVQKAHKGLGKHALAGARLAHDGQALPPVDVQGDPADGVEHLAPQGEFHVQVPDGQNGLSFHDMSSFT